MSNYKVGDKVVPHSYTYGGNGDVFNSVIWRRATKILQPYLFIVGWQEEYKCWILSEKNEFNNDGDYYTEPDFTPYIEQPEEKKTFKVRGEQNDILDWLGKELESHKFLQRVAASEVNRASAVIEYLNTEIKKHKNETV